jgi:hypothetical protein
MIHCCLGFTFTVHRDQSGLLFGSALKPSALSPQVSGSAAARSEGGV